MEIWKDIPGYENLYQVSSYGNVRSLNYRNKHITHNLKLYLDKHGYYRVDLHKNGKIEKWLVSRLVATVFIPNPHNLPQVNHKDENKTNNNVKNLEWCTNEYNHNYGTRNERVGKSLSKKVICITTGEIFNSMREACRKYNIHTGSMTECCQGKRKTAGGYKWEYFKEEI